MVVGTWERSIKRRGEGNEKIKRNYLKVFAKAEPGC
jgi:hypothetical protein